MSLLLMSMLHRDFSNYLYGCTSIIYLSLGAGSLTPATWGGTACVATTARHHTFPINSYVLIHFLKLLWNSYISISSFMDFYPFSSKYKVIPSMKRDYFTPIPFSVPFISYSFQIFLVGA